MVRRSMSVLVGDDDASVVECVVEILGGRNFEVHTAFCGSEALQILVNSSIDLTILDIHFPDMTGFDVLDRYLEGPFVSDTESGSVRRASRGPLPAIFMSGDVTPEVQHRCDRVGWPLLDKPFAVADMRAAIDRICEISLETPQ